MPEKGENAVRKAVVWEVPFGNKGSDGPTAPETPHRHVHPKTPKARPIKEQGVQIYQAERATKLRQKTEVKLNVPKPAHYIKQ